MLRIAQGFPFSHFYHPCRFALPAHLAPLACKLTAYVALYRAYGHYYATLDPLGLYNK